MLLKRLINLLDQSTLMPIEISDVVNEIKSIGIQDEINFIACDLDPEKLQGIYHQYRYQSSVYGDPVWVTNIVYSNKVSYDLQRIISCKELIHIFDKNVAKTNSEEDINGLMDKLLGPLSTEGFGIHDLMATVDRVAYYQAVAILFPNAARLEAMQKLMEGKITIDQIAAWASLPKELCELVISDKWLTIREFLINLSDSDV